MSYLSCCLIENSKLNKGIFSNLIFLWLDDKLEWFPRRWRDLDDFIRFALSFVSKSFICLSFSRFLICCYIVCIFFFRFEGDFGGKREYYTSSFWISCISISSRSACPALGIFLVFDEDSPDRWMVIIIFLGD